MKFVYPLCCLAIAASANAEPVSFRNQVAPILVKHCLACHRHDRAEGGFRVDTWTMLKRAGDSGASPVVPVRPEQSELFLRIVADDPDIRMPLEGRPLADGERQLIYQWIAEGANYDADDQDASLSELVPVSRYSAPLHPYPLPLPVTAVGWSDGRLWASGYHEISSWRLGQDLVPRRDTSLIDVPQRTYAICVLPGQQRVAVAGGSPGKSGEVRLFDISKGQLLGVPVRSKNVLLCLSVTRDGRLLAAGGADRSVHVCDLETGQVARHSPHADWIYAISFDADGKRIASASRDNTVKVMDARSGNLLTNYQGHDQPVHCAVFAGDTHVVSLAGDSLQRWKIADGKRDGDAKSLSGKVAAASAHESMLVVLTTDGHLQSYDLRDLDRQGDARDVGEASLSLTMADSGHFVGCRSGRVVFVPANKSQCIGWQASPLGTAGRQRVSR